MFVLRKAKYPQYFECTDNNKPVYTLDTDYAKKYPDRFSALIASRQIEKICGDNVVPILV